MPGVPHPVGELLVRGPTLLHSYVGTEPGASLTEDGYYPTGDLAWVSDDRRVWLLGREKELIRWGDGSYVDPQHLSNLLVRSVFVKDAMVVHRQPDDPYLSVYLFPDRKRIARGSALEEVDQRRPGRVHGAQGPDGRGHRVRRIRRPYYRSVAQGRGVHPTLRLERTPTHKIKFIFERERIHEAVALTGGSSR